MVALALLAGCGSGSGDEPEPLTVELTIRYSHFEPSTVMVPHGQPVTFVIRNEDPIDHEWIVGSDAVHVAHRTGTEPVHGVRPTEISVGPLGVAVTTITFDEPGTEPFICHLPLHEDYGMVGLLIVT